MSESPENDWEEANDIFDTVKHATRKDLPLKSKLKYKAAYDHFIDWKRERNTVAWNESIFLDYFRELIGKVKPPTLYARFSMLKSTIFMNDNVDIGPYKELTTLIKNASKGYKSIEPKALTNDEIHKFLKDAPNYCYLAVKVALIFGVCGALKKKELCNVKTKDIQDMGNHLVVKVKNDETKTERLFAIHGQLFYDLYKTYVERRPRNMFGDRFFLKYHNGTCSQQVIGINKFGSMPKLIANYLNLPEAERYTGHSIRRTSAILQADLGTFCPGQKKLTNKRNAIENSLDFDNSPNKQIRLEFMNSPSTSDSYQNKYSTRCYKGLKDEKKLSDPEFPNLSVRYENLSLENLYNADEMKIDWRPLTSSDIEKNNENNASNYVSTIFCANATGTHRIPLFTIGNSETKWFNNLNKNELKFFNDLNVVYTHQAQSNMDQQIFLLWYKKVFIPQVMEHKNKSDTQGKIILILDNDPRHPTLKELNQINKDFQVLPLPNNLTEMTQPMRQGLMSLTRKHYKNNLIKQALLCRNGVENYLEKFTLTNGLKFLSDAWDVLDTMTLKKVWNLFLSTPAKHKDPLMTIDDDDDDDDDVIDNESMIEESTSILENKSDQLRQFLTEANWTTTKAKENFLQWFKDENREKMTKMKKNEKNDEMQRDFNQMKNNLSEMRNEFAELKNKFAEMKNQMSCENKSREIVKENSIIDDSVFMEIKDEIDDNDLEDIEIEESKEFFDEMQKNTFSEAYKHFQEFKNWMKSSEKFSKKHFDYIDEIENIMRQET